MPVAAEWVLGHEHRCEFGGCAAEGHRRGAFVAPSAQRIAGYSTRRPLIAREITSCWICSVPSKMS
jgi:hypothetical protein